MNRRKLQDRIRVGARRTVGKLRGMPMAHLLHIGKTGGTAVKHAIEPHLSRGDYVIQLHPHGATLREIPVGEHVIFFHRDPVSRFVSGFYSRQRQGLPRHFSPWRPDEREAFERFRTANQLAIALSSSDPTERAEAQRSMTSIRHVRSSYWDWFESEEYFTLRRADILFVGAQERLARDFDVLKRKLGLPDEVQLPAGEVESHRNPTGLDTRLEPEAVANLRAWYEKDYHFIALCDRLSSAP